jgi:hypothetical protein
MEKGTSLQVVAAAFTSLGEFAQLYGSAPLNNDVLTKIYQNVLHRPADPAGFDFWLGLLNNKAISVATCLWLLARAPKTRHKLSARLRRAFCSRTSLALTS